MRIRDWSSDVCSPDLEDGGGSVYFRLSTRSLPQRRRAMAEDLRRDILAGAYWLIEPAGPAELVIAYCGAVVPEVLAAYDEMKDEVQTGRARCREKGCQ